MVVPPGNHRGSDLRRTCSVRRKVRDPRTPGRTAISAVVAGGSCIMRAKKELEGTVLAWRRKTRLERYFLSACTTAPVMPPKKRAPLHERGPKKDPAATYSPTPLPGQYHRRWGA